MIYLGSDHGGYELKNELKKYIEELGLEFVDIGTNDNKRCDFPIYAQKVCESMKECDLGVLICKTGIGMSITANKFKGIRAALCFNEEMAKLSKQHNDANVLVLPANYIKPEKAIRILRYFLAKTIEDKKYIERVQMIKDIEKNNFK